MFKMNVDGCIIYVNKFIIMIINVESDVTRNHCYIDCSDVRGVNEVTLPVCRASVSVFLWND